MKIRLFTVVCGIWALASGGWAESVELNWDSGAEQHGTDYVTNYTETAQDSSFSIMTPASVSVDSLWRVVLEVEEGEADLYIKKNSEPTPTSYLYKSENEGNDSVVSELKANEQWYILVKAEAGSRWKVFAGDLHIEVLSWDDANVESGSEIVEKINAVAGDYYFKITTEAPELAAWRSVLNVSSGDANLYLQKDVPPSLNSKGTDYDEISERVGDDGLVMPLSPSTGAGEEWYLLVRSLGTSSWNVFAGDVFVKNLGALTLDESSSSGRDVIPPEGLRFYRTSIPVDTYGWRLWLRDGDNAQTKTNAVYVRKEFVPLSESASYHDRMFREQELFVLDYIETGSLTPFFISIKGTPGEQIRLDSRKHGIEDIAYGIPLESQVVSGYLYKTYRVTVPPDLLAWEVSLIPSAGTNPDFSLGFDGVPSPDFNDAYSEFPSASVSESVTIVPPSLRDGAAYITVYGKTDLAFELRNGEPSVTPIEFISMTVNTDTNRAGWRFFSVTDIDSQKGHLGWMLELTNQVAGTEIAIQRNALPGHWNYRPEADKEESVFYNDKSSTYGFLQNPAHPADIWYVGVYTPAAELGAFSIESSVIVPKQINTFDYAERTVSNLVPKSWAFYHIDVPSEMNGTNYLGWNVRLTSVSGGGQPSVVVRADNLPDSLDTSSGSGTWGAGSSPEVGTAWASGSQWANEGGDWTAYDFDTTSPACMLTAAYGRPLTSGSYYIGFYNNQELSPISFTFESKAIGEGLAYDVQELTYEGGEAVVTDLAARDVAYFKVNVPTNSPSWKVWLENTEGDSSLYIRRGYIPTWEQDGDGADSPDLMFNGKVDPTLTRLQKPEDEYFILLPENYPALDGSHISTITPAFYSDVAATNGFYTYYLMVVSEGVGGSQVDNLVGSGASSAILHSEGVVEEYAMGEVLMGNSSVTVHDSYHAGEPRCYTFTEDGVGWIQVDLDVSAGTPSYLYRWSVYAASLGGYGGYFSGYTLDPKRDHRDISNWNNQGHIVVYDARNALDVTPSEYDLTLSRWPSEDLVADGGIVSVTNAGTVVYKVVVPDEVNGFSVLGWELKLKDWDGVRPYMTVARERFPNPNTLTRTSTWKGSWGVATKPAGGDAFNGHWATDKGDWTSYKYDPSLTTQYPEYILSMAMGRPLQPGTYYISISAGAASSSALSYTLESRLIGTEQSYDPQPISFDGGSAVTTNLSARSVSYYYVDISANKTSWKVWLDNQEGETSLYIRRGHVPTLEQDGRGTYSPRLASDEGFDQLKEIDQVVHLEKTGDEHYVLLPEENQPFIPEGRYYLMVVSDGQNPEGAGIGAGTSRAALHSQGEASVLDLGQLENDTVREWALSAATGEVHLVQFRVPEDVLGLEIRLLNRVGEMNLKLSSNGLFAAMDDGGYGGLFSENDADYEGEEVITVSSPAAGIYSLLISDPADIEDLVSGDITLQISALGAIPVEFNGGAGSSQQLGVLGPETWHYYKVTVPDGALNRSLVGWEVQMMSWSGERPYLVIRRDELPEGTRTTSGSGTWGTQSSPIKGDGWTSGSQWATDKFDWTGTSYDSNHEQRDPSYLLSMALGQPLEGGTYYIGIYNSSDDENCEYRFETRGVGAGQDMEVQEIAFEDGEYAVTNLAPRAAAYFSVEVPEGMASWKLHLENTSGETALFVRKNFVPTWGASFAAFNSPGKQIDRLVGLRKTGDENYVVLPEDGEATLRSGTYYLMMVSQGDLVPGSSDIGTNSSSAIVQSLGEAEVWTFTVPLGAGAAMLSDTNALEAGEVSLYQFDLAPGVAALEVRLTDRVGDLECTLLAGNEFPDGSGSSSRYGGLYSPYNPDEEGTLLTVANPVEGRWSLVVSSPSKVADITDGSYRLEIVALPTPELNFDHSQNATGGTHVASGVLMGDQRDYYRIVVPETVDGDPVLGWYLQTDVTQGAAWVRATPELLPSDDGGSSQMKFASPSMVVTDPVLSPGVWYVEVKGEGDTVYTLSSSALRPERGWAMPAADDVMSFPGLSGSLFGDTGVEINGTPLPDDQGVDLYQGNYHLYVVDVPTNNAGLFRTQLQAISGNPNLYIRRDYPPTLDHDSNGYGEMVDHQLDSDINTEYGTWVPADSRYEKALPPGKWYLLVKADGTSNARYRLTLGAGNTVLNGIVQDMPYDGGSFGNQQLVANDWRYYRVEVPFEAKMQWALQFAQSSGDVDLYLRDTVPPGNFEEFSTRARDLLHWESDGKSGSYPDDAFQDQGEYTIEVPPLRPGHVYYLGFLAKSDAVFSLSTSAEGALIPTYPALDFFDGSLLTNLPGNSGFTYQIDVPEHAVRWIHSATNSTDISFALRQGIPPLNGASDWSSEGEENSMLGQLLISGDSWPWVPGQRYYLSVTNTSATMQDVDFEMQGSSAPEAPPSVRATDGNYPTYIRVSWPRVDGASKYDVWRSVGPNPATAVRIAAGITGTSYSDSNPVAGVLNYYWVSLSLIPSGANVIDWLSPVDSGWIPGMGTGLSETSFSFDYKRTERTISVYANSNVFWKVTDKPAWVYVSSSADEGHGDGEITYRVNWYAGAVDREGILVVAGQTYTIYQSAYGVVENVQATKGGFSQAVNLTWDLKEDASRYYIYRSESDDTSTATSLTSTTGDLHADTTALLGHTYYYWVRPYINGGGKGGYGLSDSGYIKITVSQDWKEQYYLDGYPGDDSDTDGDGFTAIEEYIAGTIPTDGASFFKIQMQKSAGDWLNFTVDQALAQRIYAVHLKDSLEEDNWVQQGEGEVGTNGPLTISIQSDRTAGFFVQTVSPEPQ